MFKTKTNPRDLLPWYVNGTLPRAERQAVEAWLRSEPTAEAELAVCRGLRARVGGQVQARPSAFLRARVKARVRGPALQPDWAARWLPRAWGMSMAVMALIVVCLVIPPGIPLQWSVEGGEAAGFRVYRATAGRDDFALLSEFAARPAARQYTFVDMFLLPWQGYAYAVEAIAPDGTTALTPPAAAHGVEALPAQAMTALVSLLVGCLATWWARGQAARQTV